MEQRRLRGRVPSEVRRRQLARELHDRRQVVRARVAPVEGRELDGQSLQRRRHREEGQRQHERVEPAAPRHRGITLAGPRPLPSRRVQVLSTPAKRPVVVAPLAILALAALLRFAFLDAQSYWLDEAVAVDTIDRSFSGMLDRIYDNESTPPLYYVVAWLWVKVAGTGEFGLRSLSAIAGTAFVGVAYLTGRKLVSQRAGLIAAALAAVSPLLVYYSQEARSYPLLMLFGGLSLLGFAHAREEPTAKALAGWARGERTGAGQPLLRAVPGGGRGDRPARAAPQASHPRRRRRGRGGPRADAAGASPAQPGPGQLPARHLAGRPPGAGAQAVPRRLRGAGRGGARRRGRPARPRGRGVRLPRAAGASAEARWSQAPWHSRRSCSRCPWTPTPSAFATRSPPGCRRRSWWPRASRRPARAGSGSRSPRRCAASACSPRSS